MKRILVASDLSSRSERALQRAARLAAEHDAALDVLHVLDDDLPIGITERLEADARAHLEGALGSLEVAGAAHLAFGRPAAEILRAADRRDADLIVMGAHRGAFLADLIMGTVLERVARNARHPLLMVRDAPAAPYQSVVVGVDFSVHARLALRTAMSLAPAAKIEALHAFHIDFKAFQLRGVLDEDAARRLARPYEQEAEREMGLFLANAAVDDPRVTAKLVEDSPDAALLRAAEANGADLIALGAHGRGGLAHAILGSLAEDMLLDPPADILVTRAW